MPSILFSKVPTKVSLLLLVLCSVSSPVLVRAERIPQNIDDTDVWRLSGNVSPHARMAVDRGAVDRSLELTGMKLIFQPTSAQQSSLNALLQQQQDRSSANYHNWLTPEQYADRFGLSRDDASRVATWLVRQGFTDIHLARSRTWISFSGPAARVETVFHTAIHRYLANGQMHYANANDPSLPAAFRGTIMAISGLDDFRLRPRAVVRSVHPHFTSDISGEHFLVPNDLATIYDIQGMYLSGINGSGWKIAVVGQSDLSKDSNHNNQYDVLTFRSAAALPTVDLQVLLVPGDKDPGIVSGDVDEANLDLEWAGGIAKKASLIYVNSQNALFDGMQYAVDQNLAPVLSISYGDCESNFSTANISTLVAMAQQANAQGQTIVASSGDSGAADCDFSNGANNPVTSATHGYAVDVPASFPYVTGVGGNEFSEGDETGATQYWGAGNNANSGSALSYIPETAWNDTAADGSLSATGGGASALFTKPTWQTGTGVPSDGQRDVPDLALSASPNHDGYLICSQSDCVNGFRKADQTLDVVGGTSAGTPTLAGIVTLIVQQANDRQGNINSLLYGLAATAPNVFHDITTGDNKVPCTMGTTDCANGGTIGYSAGTGYDLATGLGSVDVGALAAAWNGPTDPDFVVTAHTQSLALTRGTPATDTVTVTGLGGYATAVNLSCVVSGTLSATTCSLSPASVSPGGTATLTITASTLAAGSRGKPHLFYPKEWMGSGMVFAVGIMLAGATRRGKQKIPPSLRRRLPVLLLICVLAGTVSCGGGGSSGSSGTQQTTTTTTPQSGSVTVEAVSGSLNHTVQIAVTVD